jgi:hypothetical protein
MKHFVKTSVATAVVLGSALVASTASAGSIQNTRHNLGTATGPNSTDGTAEICIFCHTPHGGDNSAPVPLWNKQLSDPGQFSTYDQLGTSTLDAAVGPVGSVSLACLTCHDGTQAIDNIINAPGSGGYNATGGGANGLDWTWATDGTLTTQGQFQNSVDVNGTNIWMIGTDLTNDHPVSMQYAGGGYSYSDQNASGGKRDIDFNDAIPIGTAGRWYVENDKAAGLGGAGAGTGFDKWDFKLYTRDTTGFANNPNNGAAFAGEKEPFVECGSCHDPHFETTTFLRMPGTVDLTTDINTVGPSAVAGARSNDQSRVCLTCHAK